ncbi:VCBS repeat-containing protein [Streptomyces sp. NBC_01220]|uniref:FG-GAP repeat domain-containing protein n=1 Tax=unclassified Streptomyces TaxID=2593676 RepID=UPI002E2DBF1E|nr:VCBS repeat-containing protein [Streptomyces sp. NBC_00184]WSQ44065.1 VCBS repeat-containing protein [Streptomyces sp. NBC_01220]
MISNRRRRTVRGALAAVAATVAMAATAGTSFASGDPAGAAERAQASAGAEQQAGKAQGAAAPAARAAGTVETPSFAMDGVTKQTGDLYMYWTDNQGGFKPGEFVTSGFDAFADSISVDNDKDGWSDHTWTVHKDGKLTYSWIDDDSEYHNSQVGKGWNIYPTILSPGSIGGAQEADLIGLDKAGVLWGYLGYPDGNLTPRTRIGGGWGQYTQLAGQGDLTGDNKPDIVARDTSGVLWLYKGTGDYKVPFATRTRIGGGWNTYDRLLSVGDLNADGVADLIARKPNGDLFRYSGTGNAGSVFGSPAQIGHGFQIYNLL